MNESNAPTGAQQACMHRISCLGRAIHGCASAHTERLR